MRFARLHLRMVSAGTRWKWRMWASVILDLRPFCRKISNASGIISTGAEWTAVPLMRGETEGGYRVLAAISKVQFGRGVSQKGRDSEDLFLSTAYGTGYESVIEGDESDRMSDAEKAELESRWRVLVGAVGSGEKNPERNALPGDGNNSRKGATAVASQVIFGIGG